MNYKTIAGAIASMLSVSALDSSGAETVDTTRVLEEVVVTGTNSGVQQRLLPYTVSVIDNRQLEASGQTQVLSAISGMVPSLFVSQRSIFGFGVSNGGSGHIKLRGVGGDRASAVLMMVDGQPQFAGIYSHHIADFYDKEYVERVEVLRGPGSVLYGSNAMAGAINVITKTARHDGVRTTVQSQYGSYNTWLSSATNMVRAGRFSSLVSLSYNRTDGTTDNFDFRQAGGYVKAGYDFSDNWKAYADYTLMNFRGNDPVYPILSDPESTDIYRQNIIRGEAAATVTNNYDRTSGSARIYYNYGNHYVDDPRHFHSKDDRLGAMLYQNFRPWKDASATMGFDFDSYSGEIPVSGGNAHTEGSLSTMSRKRITEYSPYLTLSQTLLDDAVSLNAGLRMANSDMFDTQWIPQFGFSLNPGYGLTFKGNLAMGYRNPSFRELYLYRMANPDLQPEKMMNYELSVSKSFSRYLSAELTAYYSKGDNLIQQVDMKNMNTGSFINKGIEVSARSHPIDNLWIQTSYSYLHTSLDNLTGAPKNQYYLGVQWRPWSFIGIDADLKGTGGLYVADGIDHQSYALVDLKITWDVCRYVSLFCRLDNITDARYMINRGYDMPGFTAMGGFRLSF
ncbi:TonB-dependent receptor plug domain-containing protein [Duncaniella muris]|uniref:TonB-dependent receptor plug domain-containing protein n=1 Tax=Duncaniella muris TaxID=2094150 RepID=UPI0025B71414|nr:TonB-dependent receptor [Duncaniella muris]